MVWGCGEEQLVGVSVREVGLPGDGFLVFTDPGIRRSGVLQFL
jgi:hypothetical protein